MWIEVILLIVLHIMMWPIMKSSILMVIWVLHHLRLLRRDDFNLGTCRIATFKLLIVTIACHLLLLIIVIHVLLVFLKHYFQIVSTHWRRTDIRVVLRSIVVVLIVGVDSSSVWQDLGLVEHFLLIERIRVQRLGRNLFAVLILAGLQWLTCVSGAGTELNLVTLNVIWGSIVDLVTQNSRIAIANIFIRMTVAHDLLTISTVLCHERIRHVS